MFNIGWLELIIILIIALIIFGPKRLPDIGKAIGRALNEFRKAAREIKEAQEKEEEEEGKERKA